MFLGNFIDGEFHSIAKADESWELFSPSDLSDRLGEIRSSYQDVDAAVSAARIAFPSWSRRPLAERIEFVEKLKAAYLRNKEAIAESISRETGKPYWESLGEAAALAGKIDITIQSSLDLVKEQVIDNALAGGVTGRIRYRPRGVLAVLGPFNFPGHLPNGHIIPALLTGNTVVLKPSELTPFTAQWIARCVQEAGLPAGVFNLVQGGGEVGRRLVKHDHVDGILFTGSYDTGLRIKQEIVTHYWKMAALEMGGKNTAIVWKDADLERALYQNLFGAFATSGQRCSCTSRILVHRDLFENFVDRFHRSAKAIKIGHWRESVFMGPLINDKAVEKFLRFQEIAQREGAENIMRGKALDLAYKGHYVSPSLNIVNKHRKDSVYEAEEIFGPNVALYPFSELEEAIAIVNESHYALSGAIFTEDRKVYEKTAEQLHLGLLNWNRPTCGASSKLPFGGFKKSGNGYPSGHFAVYYCTEPVAYLEDSSSFDANETAIGLEVK